LKTYDEVLKDGFWAFRSVIAIKDFFGAFSFRSWSTMSISTCFFVRFEPMTWNFSPGPPIKDLGVRLILVVLKRLMVV
jgi:hypothetical protein